MRSTEAGGSEFPRLLTSVPSAWECVGEEVEERETLVRAGTLWVLIWAHNREAPSSPSAWAVLNGSILQMGKGKL